MKPLWKIIYGKIWRQEKQINRAYCILYESDLIDRNTKITNEEGRDIIANKKILCIAKIAGDMK